MRRPPQSAEDRLIWAVMSMRAIGFARHLVAGIWLAPGEREMLARMPPDVQAAVWDCWNPPSRYLPKSMHEHRAALAKARAEGRISVKPREWSQDLHVALESADAEAAGRARGVRVTLPANVPGARRIREAVAAAAGTTVETLRAWERKAATIRSRPSKLQRSSDAVLKALAAELNTSIEALRALEREQPRIDYPHSELLLGNDALPRKPAKRRS